MEPEPSKPDAADRHAFQDALQFAAVHHAAQVRKGTSVPYVTHPVIVAETLAYYYPDRPALALAGLLHDAVEDTHATLTSVCAQFGPEVAELVGAVTKPPKANVTSEKKDGQERKVDIWKQQRQAMLDALAKGEDEETVRNVLRLKAADALANLRAIQRDLANPNVGESVWGRFKVGREPSLWFYQRIHEHMGPIRDEVLVRELGAALEVVGGTATAPAPSSFEAEDGQVQGGAELEPPNCKAIVEKYAPDEVATEG